MNGKEIRFIKMNIKQKYASIIRSAVLTIFHNSEPTSYWISFSIMPAHSIYAGSRVLRLFLLKNYSIIKF